MDVRYSTSLPCASAEGTASEAGAGMVLATGAAGAGAIGLTLDAARTLGAGLIAGFGSARFANGFAAGAFGAGALDAAGEPSAANGFALGGVGAVALGAAAPAPRRLGSPRITRFCGAGADNVSVSCASADTACGSSPSSRWICRSAMRFIPARTDNEGRGHERCSRPSRGPPASTSERGPRR